MSKQERKTYNRMEKAFTVKGITNEKDAEILDFCDPYNFGGIVIRLENGDAIVTVYVDWEKGEFSPFFSRCEKTKHAEEGGAAPRVGGRRRPGRPGKRATATMRATAATMWATLAS